MKGEAGLLFHPGKPAFAPELTENERQAGQHPYRNLMIGKGEKEAFTGREFFRLADISKRGKRGNKGEKNKSHINNPKNNPSMFERINQEDERLGAERGEEIHPENPGLGQNVAVGDRDVGGPPAIVRRRGSASGQLGENLVV